jgi:3-oxoacyl-[acyl-carrier-protein] synthase-3
MAGTRHRTRIDLERLTGIRSRRYVSPGEDSLTLAVGAAEDALTRAGCDARDLDIVIGAGITRYVDGLRARLEPPLSLAVKQAIGADTARCFDISNACAGMMTGVFILNNLIRQGRVRRGMVVSGEYISHIAGNAAMQVRTLLSKQVASLTLGDAGAAAILEAAPPSSAGIDVAAFTTLAQHSRLCLAFPAKNGPGATMRTDARGIHKAAIGSASPLLREVMERAGLALEDVDCVIPHQTSARAIKKGLKEISERVGGAPKHVVVTVDEVGNTASTSHFVALAKYLREGRLAPDDRVVLLAFASGLVVGIVVFTVGALGGGHGHGH